MDWTAFIDGYCERTDASYWSEPVNAVTNLAFIIAAAIMWRRTAGLGLPLARALVAILFAIGIGSYLFHTHAQTWAAISDSTPIMLFSLLYIFLASRDYFGLPTWVAGLLTAAYFPYSFAVGWVAAQLPFFSISDYYWPLPLLIAIYAVLLRNRYPETARGLAIGSAILVASLTFRSLDMPVCGAFPLGTHFMWHILNGLMLGWMIEVYRRHMLAARSARG